MLGRTFEQMSTYNDLGLPETMTYLSTTSDRESSRHVLALTSCYSRGYLDYAGDTTPGFARDYVPSITYSSKPGRTERIHLELSLDEFESALRKAREKLRI